MNPIKDEFIKKALAAGFDDTQAEFLWMEFGGGQWEGGSNLG